MVGIAWASLDAVAFDVEEFFAQRTKHALTYVWQPPNSDAIRVDHCLPWHMTRHTQCQLSLLGAWASHGDPSGEILRAYAKQQWDNRAPGVEIVVLGLKESVATP